MALLKFVRQGIDGMKFRGKGALIGVPSIGCALLLAGCTYGSMWEAEQACKEWESKGGKFINQYESNECESFRLWDRRGLWNTKCSPGEERIKVISNEMDRRFCDHEEATRQFLGKEHVATSPGSISKPNSSDTDQIKVIKYFKYPQ